MTSTATWTEHDVNIGGATVHYARMGTRAGEPVVLLHGFSDAGLCWVRLASDLASDYDLILPDAAGHGRTTPAAAGQSLERAVSDVLGLLDALELPRVTLVGHSMGAATAAMVAGRAPERVRGAALEDPPWRDGGMAPQSPGVGSHAPLRSPEWTAWIRSLQSLGPDELQALGDRERPEWPAEERPYWIQAKAQFNVDAAAEIAVRDPSTWRDTVRDLRSPTLLVTGDLERGAIVSPAVADEARRLNAHVRVVHVPGAGHNIRREQYAPFKAAVSEFLKDVSRS